MAIKLHRDCRTNYRRYDITAIYFATGSRRTPAELYPRNNSTRRQGETRERGISAMRVPPAVSRSLIKARCSKNSRDTGRNDEKFIPPSRMPWESPINLASKTRRISQAHFARVNFLDAAVGIANLRANRRKRPGLLNLIGSIGGTM